MTKFSIIRFLLCLLIAEAVATACSSPSSTNSPLLLSQSPLVQSPIATQASEVTTFPIEAPAEAPIPEAGKASISGVLYSFTSDGPIPETVLYLTPARGEAKRPPSILVGPRKELGDIQGVSDDHGQIFLNNIPPGNYYLAVWAPYDWILAVESTTDITPRLIELEPNQREALGIIYLSWP